MKKMRLGMKFNSGDVVIAKVQFTDTFETKTRPAVVLFEELGNVIIAGITSNKNMDGIPFLKSEGSVRDSVIKLNYIFTISESMVSRIITRLSSEKQKEIYNGLLKKLGTLNE
jgi:mRNA interferase MazF